MMKDVLETEPGESGVRGVAIVGLAGRFPGADDVTRFWQLLRDGRSAITRFSSDTLLAAGVDAATVADPRYVKARGVLEHAECFDAGFFGYSPREAQLTDPQQRVFLECAWSALEDAGYAGGAGAGSVGVYAGAAWNSYLLFNLAGHPELMSADALHQVLLGNEKDNLATRVSYELDLTGPSVAIQTGCSTSLVAVVMGCQALLGYQCDTVLAGGVSIAVPQLGYHFQPGGIFSPDGLCRAFDARAEGTVMGSGAGVVVLKRLQDAIADRDHIYAVISGAAINNDGGTKLGYTAPSASGQAQAIALAHAMAEVNPRSIGYVEAHGTGTPLGDPIEVRALTQAFRVATADEAFCGIGSVKTNIGHLDAAAGAAGLIKTALALHHRVIPATLNYETANPHLGLEGSPFYVNARARPWDDAIGPRRAAVSSFGLGGTNAHVVLEEAPAASRQLESAGDDRPQLLVLSARSLEQLDQAGAHLADHLERNDVPLEDVAFTLQVGRRAFSHRRWWVATSRPEAVELLRDQRTAERQTATAAEELPGAAFMFPGQGTQRIGMGARLYQSQPVYRRHVDECLDLLGWYGRPIAASLTASDSPLGRDIDPSHTAWAQPALFVFEYCLAQLLQSWGVRMVAGIGHSVGEFVAATLAGVFELREALHLVRTRGELIQSLPGGAMLAVRCSLDRLQELLGPQLSLAAINAPEACVVSGPHTAVDALEPKLRELRIAAVRLRTSHAFHSQMMDPICGRFADALKGVRLRAPHRRFVSNVTGTWITTAEATAPDYWVRHLREPVRFADGIRCLLETTAGPIVEVGAGRVLSDLVQKAAEGSRERIITLLPEPAEGGLEVRALQEAVGSLWSRGLAPRWNEMGAARARRRVPLPAYPFARERHWLDAPGAARSSSDQSRRWADLALALQAQAQEEVSGFDVEASRAREESLARVALDFVKEFLVGRGLFTEAGASFTRAALSERSGIDSRFEQLLQRWVDLLIDAGELSVADGVVRSASGLSLSARERHRAEARRLWSAVPEVLDLVERCGAALGDVVRGLKEPLELFSAVVDGSVNEAQVSFGIQTQYRSVLRRGVEHLVSQLPPDAALRVLEVGGGTGIATAEVLPLLPPERTQYVFSDVARLFLSQASKKFTAFPFVRFAQLDIERRPAEQGQPRGAYDLVLAVNVLHATRDIHATLEHVAGLLKPGGVVMLAELTRATVDFATTYSLLMNPITDGERDQGAPFLSASGWSAALAAHGFEDVICAPQDSPFGHHVILARRAGHPSARAGSFGLSKRPDISDWFYAPSWKRSVDVRAASTLVERLPGTRWLVFAEGSPLSSTLVARLESLGATVTTVSPGHTGLKRIQRHAFEIDPRDPTHYDAVLRDLEASGGPPTHVLHAWSLANGEHELTTSVVEQAAEHGLISLTLLASALGSAASTASVRLGVLTANTQDVFGGSGSPHSSLVTAACRVMPLEYRNISCVAVDLERPSETQREMGGQVDDVFLDLLEESPRPVVAHRGGYCWVPSLEPVRVEPQAARQRLRSRGVYLITGGLGKIGLSLAEHLAKTRQARSVLVARSDFPETDAWDDWVAAHGADDPVSRKIHILRNICALGGDVLVLRADVSDLGAMRQVVARATERFGAINGVIHAAGVLNDGAIHNKTAIDVENGLAAKVSGTVVLHTLFERSEIDFFVLFSSMSASRPGFGQLVYSAANVFLGAFASSPWGRQHAFTSCIEWDVWQGDGMAYDAVAPAQLRAMRDDDFRQRGILPEEGATVFERVLSSDRAHVLVCTSDYLRMLEDASTDLSQIYLAKLASNGSADVNQERPQLRTEFVAPTGETEEKLAGIWSGLLGVDGIGANDDFFALGGDSLIGTQLLARIEQSFGVRLAMKEVYTERTIRGLAEALHRALLAGAGAEKIQQILDSIESR